MFVLSLWAEALLIDYAAKIEAKYEAHTGERPMQKGIFPIRIGKTHPQKQKGRDKGNDCQAKLQSSTLQVSMLKRTPTFTT